MIDSSETTEFVREVFGVTKKTAFLIVSLTSWIGYLQFYEIPKLKTNDRLIASATADSLSAIRNALSLDPHQRTPGNDGATEIDRLRMIRDQIAAHVDSYKQKASTGSGRPASADSYDRQPSGDVHRVNLNPRATTESE